MTDTAVFIRDEISLFVRDIDAFLKGYKPALLNSSDYYRPEEIEALNKYPCIENIALYGSQFNVYFQTEDMKRDFVQKVSGVATSSPVFCKELGRVLGFPPKATAFYIECMENPSLAWKKIGMYYCGISCVGSIDDLVENVLWFWATYELPNHEYRVVELSYGMNEPAFRYYIPYRDKESLYTAQEEIQFLAEMRKKD